MKIREESNNKKATEIGITMYLSKINLMLMVSISHSKDTDCQTVLKNKTSICCLEEIHLTGMDKFRLKVKGWKMIFQTNEAWKQVGIPRHISDKVDFKSKLIKRDKGGFLIEGKIHKEEVTILNTHPLNINSSNFLKQTLLETKVKPHSKDIIVGVFNIPFSVIDHSDKKNQKRNFIIK
jgi:hypothetical protein